MRTLKYRAYIKPLKRYAEKYETILYHHQCNMEPSWTVNISPEEYYGDEDLVIEQFTGLLDRNGIEIYEGDIVEEDIDFNSEMTDGTFKYKVYWNEDELCWSLDPIGPESIHNDLWELNSSCRVIGNIHEPPKIFRPEHLKRMGVTMMEGDGE